MNQLLAIIPYMCVVLIASAQRAPFAGSRPNGYKDKLQTDNTINNANNNGIADRFGETTNTDVGGTTAGTTAGQLPHLALGDRDIVDRLNNLPVDQRPFWLINAQAIEAQKNQGRPSNPTTNPTNTGGIVNRFGSGSTENTNVNRPVNANRPNYATVVYPLEMTPEQQQQAQQAFNNQMQQKLSNNQRPSNSNPLSSRIDIQQQPLVAQQTINNGPKQIPQQVQGRLPTSGSGYRG